MSCAGRSMVARWSRIAGAAVFAATVVLVPAGTAAGPAAAAGEAASARLELHLWTRDATWEPCPPFPGLIIYACNGAGTEILDVIVGTGVQRTTLGPP